MKIRQILSLGWIVLLAVLLSHGWTQMGVSAPEFDWQIPYGIPRPVVPADNPMTPEKVALGRKLFYDKRLSVNGQISCGSCHHQALAFSDGKATSTGATGEQHPRNAMSLTNVAYNSVLTWANPHQTRLEDQLLVPLFGEHPVEMGMVGREQELVQLLRQDPDYSRGFRAAFTDSTFSQSDPITFGAPEVITLANLAKAIAAFERTLISFNSPYDRYRFGGDVHAISASAQRGESLFLSEKLECFHCHGGLNFSDTIRHEKLAFTEIAFHNTGLYNLNGRGEYPFPNTGVYEITGNPEDMGRFKAPTLRNIDLTAPYMHDGSIATLSEVIDHYAQGGRTISSGVHTGVGRENPYKSLFVGGFEITEAEKQDLIAFLRSLTDPVFITNPNLSDAPNILE
jgi:cytochrome c peroxidase